MEGDREKERSRFIESHRHECYGWVTDAMLTQKSGAPLATWLRDMMRKIDRNLGAMYDALNPKAMSPLDELRLAGLQPKLSGDGLKVGPAENMTEEWKQFVTANKADILRELEAEKKCG